MAASLDVSELARFAAAQLSERADPERARAMAGYMKTDMPFYGVSRPELVPVFRALGAAFPITTAAEYRDAVLALWNLPHREEKYLAIALARSRPEHITIGSVKLYRKIIVEGAWWDFVDEVAAHLVGGVLRNDADAMWPILDEWIDDRHLWLRRTALLAQLRLKDRTDADRLFDYCLRRCNEKEFFIRKAIGWALRDYAKTNPAAVVAFLAAHGSELSPLSYREAAKHLSL